MDNKKNKTTLTGSFKNIIDNHPLFILVSIAIASILTTVQVVSIGYDAKIEAIESITKVDKSKAESAIDMVRAKKERAIAKMERDHTNTHILLGKCNRKKEALDDEIELIRVKLELHANSENEEVNSDKLIEATRKIGLLNNQLRQVEADKLDAEKLLENERKNRSKQKTQSSNVGNEAFRSSFAISRLESNGKPFKPFPEVQVNLINVGNFGADIDFKVSINHKVVINEQDIKNNQVVEYSTNGTTYLFYPLKNGGSDEWAEIKVIKIPNPIKK